MVSADRQTHSSCRPTEDELIAVLKKAHEEGIPVTVIGGGSNCLVSDLGIRGITICMNRMQQNMTCEGTWITATGGTGTGTVSRFAEKNSLRGFEWAVGIPGTVIGAAFMNANGYGSQMKNVVEEVYAVSRDGLLKKTYGWDDLHYGDSDSISCITAISSQASRSTLLRETRMKSRET